MKGSEKQIRWANDLTDRVCGVLSKACEQVKSNPNEVAMYNHLIEAIKGAELASDVIEMFKDYNVTGDLKKDFNALIHVYNFYGKIGTESQRKALGR